MSKGVGDGYCQSVRDSTKGKNRKIGFSKTYSVGVHMSVYDEEYQGRLENSDCFGFLTTDSHLFFCILIKELEE